MKLNDISQENKILRKKLEEAGNQPDQSRPTSPTPFSTPSVILSPTPQPPLNKTIKKHDVTIETITEQHRSGF